MAFWIGILVGGIFAWITIELRFYQTWALVFNIIISIYLGLYLRSAIAKIPAVGDTSYSNALTIATIALASFLILQGISYTFLTGQFKVSFPKILDVVGTGLLGFLAGFLIWSFLSLLIYVTPISQNTFVKEEIGFDAGYQNTVTSYVSKFCNLVNVIASQDNEHSAEQTISKLLEDFKSKVQVKTPEKSELIEPAKKPGDAKTDDADQNQLGPPPEDELEI